MSEEFSNPLLTLIKESGLIDDLQYEEVIGELQRTATPAIQVLQDFGIMKLDDILHVMATALGTEVVSVKDREFSPEIIKLIPAKVAQMYSAIQTGSNVGMQTLDQCLTELVKRNLISLGAARFAAKIPENFPG